MSLRANLSLKEPNEHARRKKKALIEAQSIVAKNDLKQADPPPVADTPSTDPPVEPTKNVLTTTQWLSVISIIVSLAGIYYKREEIKSVFTKRAALPSPVVPRAPPPSPLDSAPPPRGIRKMDWTSLRFNIWQKSKNF